MYFIHLQVLALLEDSAVLAKRGPFNSLKVDSENVAALKCCLTEERDVTLNMKDTLAKCVCLVACKKEIYITNTCFCKHLAENSKIQPTTSYLEEHIERVRCRLLCGPKQQ